LNPGSEKTFGKAAPKDSIVRIPDMTPWSYPKRKPPSDANYLLSVSKKKGFRAFWLTNATPSRYGFCMSFTSFGAKLGTGDALL
jgi:hypothetical protein